MARHITGNIDLLYTYLLFVDVPLCLPVSFLARHPDNAILHRSRITGMRINFRDLTSFAAALIH
jgi:hypothetical protein